MSPTDNRARRDRYWKGEPMQTIRAGGPYRCPDARCGEDIVLAVPHPDDATHTPNRCPTCLETVVAVNAR